MRGAFTKRDSCINHWSVIKRVGPYIYRLTCTYVRYRDNVIFVLYADDIVVRFKHEFDVKHAFWRTYDSDWSSLPCRPFGQAPSD